MKSVVSATIEYGRARISTTPLREHLKREGDDGLRDLRIVPLLFSEKQSNFGESFKIAVGHCQISERNDGQFTVLITIVDSWEIENLSSHLDGNLRSNKVLRQVHGVADNSVIQRMEDSVKSGVETIINTVISHGGFPDIPLIAKVLCEESRDTMNEVRDLRYEFEANLALASIDFKGSELYTRIVASLVQINVLCGRSADQAREANREGLWIYLTDREVYHAYRKLQDPTILNEFQPAEFGMRPWIRVHDAAIRQCVQLQQQAEAETSAIQALISSATGISSSREADAQSRFNLLAALLSIGLGIPGLFLALYGATAILPLDNVPETWVYVPIVVPLVVVAILAFIFSPKGNTGIIWKVCAGATVAVIISLVIVAVNFPASSETIPEVPEQVQEQPAQTTAGE